MKPSRFSKQISKASSQRGDFLIESLIGVLLIGIVGVGIASTASKVTKAQVQSQEQAQIISKLEGIASGGVESEICGAADSLGLTSSEFSKELKYKQATSCDDDTNQIKTLDITVDGKTVKTKQPLVMTVEITEGNGTAVLRVGQTTE